MRRRGPSWENYEKTRDEAQAAQSALADAQQELADLKTLNKQMLTEMQVECADSVVPVSDAKFVNGLGKYMVPVEGTLINHYRLIYDRSNELDFWPEQSPAFDGLVAQTFLDPAFSRSNHPRYFDYEPLRDNIATVRNYVLHSVMNGVDTTNPAQMKNAERKLEQMGREIGVALQRDSLFRRPGSDHLDVSKASVPGEGAALMYQLLDKKQQKNKILHPVKAFFGYDYQWNLCPIEKSPFSKANVEAFCLGDFSQPGNPSHANELEAVEMTKAAKRARQEAEALQAQTQPAPETAAEPTPAAPQPAQSFTDAKSLSVLGAAIAGSAFSLDRVKRLPNPVKDRSVQIARDILDKLRVEVGTSDRQEWLSLSSEEAKTQGEAIASIAELYAESYQAALVVDPNLKNDVIMQSSNEAVGKLAYLMKQQAAQEMLAEGNADDAQMLMAEIEQFPAEWKQVDGVQVGELLDQMQYGLEHTHTVVQEALQEHARTKAELTQQVASAKGISQQQHAATEQMQSVAAAQQQASAVCTPPRLDAQQLQNMLQNGGLSAQDLETVRHMQNQAAQMPTEAAQMKHADTVTRSATPESVAQQGNYRGAVQNQQREAEVMKR